MRIACSPPIVPRPESAYVTWIDAELSCHRSLAFHALKLHDLLKLFVAKFRPVMLASAGPATAPLFHHVAGVVLREAKKKMRWIDALGVVAPVANVHPAGNNTIVMSKGKCVRPNCFCPVPERAISAHTKRGSSPVPALSGLVRVVMKPLFCGHAFGGHVVFRKN